MVHEMLPNCIQWPQSLDDNKTPLMASSSNNMEKTNPNPQEPPLKCPRCDSSNTKFCYYNNYSLSQPRHFCKACKRYWTRGGTLRNVPVGGGCRKNKRIKRSSAPAADVVVSSIPNPNLFYNNIPTFPFSNFRVSSNPDHNSSGFDQPHHTHQFNGFSSIQDPNHNSFFFGSSSSTSTMASLLASTFHHPPNLIPYEDPKAEEVWRNPNPNPIDSSDPSLWNNNTNLGPWFDPGPSVPSLI